MTSAKTLGELIHGEPVQVTPEATALEAAKLMAAEKIGSVLVLAAGRLLGILTERDLIFKVLAVGKDPGRTPVKDVMTPNPITASAKTPIEDAADILRKHGFRHLPVMEAGSVCGVISLRDLLSVEVQEVLAEMYHLKMAMLRGDRD